MTTQNLNLLRLRRSRKCERPPCRFFLRPHRRNDATGFGRYFPPHGLEGRAFEGISHHLAFDSDEGMASRKDEGGVGGDFDHGGEQLLFRIFRGRRVLWRSLFGTADDELGTEGANLEDPHRYEFVRGERTRLIEQAGIELPGHGHAVRLRAKDLQLHQRHERIVHRQCHLHRKLQGDDRRDDKDAVQQKFVLRAVVVLETLVQNVGRQSKRAIGGGGPFPFRVP